MKRFLLIATAAMAVSTMANAQAVEDASIIGPLELEWYAAPDASLAAGAARAGVGVNGKFYVTEHGKGIHIIGEGGIETKMIPNATAWVSINCDDAGHVYFRNDDNGFPGPDWAGWYVPGWGKICVIDAATDELIREDLRFDGGGKCRFDALPHIEGNMMEGYFEMSAPVNATAHRIYNWIFSEGIDKPAFFEEISIDEYFKAAEFPTAASGNTMTNIATLGNTQKFTVGEVEYLAVLPNQNVELSFSLNGWGNNIALLAFDEELETYALTGKFIDTPNHSGVGGFHIFTYNDEQYIVYPSGQQTAMIPSADGFAVKKVTLVDTPQNDVDQLADDLRTCTAIKFGTDGLASGNNWRGINVEPVEGEDGKFTIYFYSPGVSMQVWTLNLNTDGIEGIVADAAVKAPVYYNLQGQRVNNPENGIFIEVRGNKAAKVVR